MLGPNGVCGTRVPDQHHKIVLVPWLLPLRGRGHFLVLSWSNNCYLGFQSAVLVAIRAA